MDKESLKPRVPEDRVVHDRKLKEYRVDLGNPDKFTEQHMAAMSHPMATARKDGND